MPLRQMRVEREGQQRWLVVPLSPEQLWPQLQGLLGATRPGHRESKTPIGVMETNWAENRTKLPNDLMRNTLGKVLGNAYDTGERDRYRTRVERTASGSEIYISHRGLIEIYSDAQREGHHLARPPGRPATGSRDAVAPDGGAGRQGRTRRAPWWQPHPCRPRHRRSGAACHAR
jgi:hypothetical protein